MGFYLKTSSAVSDTKGVRLICQMRRTLRLSRLNAPARAL